MKPRLTLLAVIVSLLFHSSSSLAQWQLDGTGLSTAASNQQTQTMISDGAGGAIVTWADFRNGSYDIYAQRVNAFGVVQWAANGVPLCTAASDQSLPTIATDGAGGAIVTWHDLRGAAYDIYAQRVNAAGMVQWAADGVALCTVTNSQANPIIISDAAGGAIVAWQDFRSGTNQDIYAQRLNSAGTAQWAVNGVVVSTATGDQIKPVIASDLASGAIVSWTDFRSSNWDVYTQRVNASGVAQWVANGVAICTAASTQDKIATISDGVGGAITTWEDNRSGTYQIYAQRVNAAGATQWPGNGLLVCIQTNNRYAPAIVSDGAGGAIVAWYDYRSGTNYDVYAQRLDPTGTSQWTGDGVVLTSATGDQIIPTIATDGASGAIVTWTDSRNGVGFSDIYAQRVNGSGAVQWAANGMAVSVAAYSQASPTIAADGAGGAIAAWTDDRSSTDVYAQRVEGTYGYWGHPEPTVTSVADVPHDQGGKVAMNWTASGRDLPTPATIDYYSLWRAVNTTPFASASPRTPLSLDKVGPDTPPGTLMKSPASSYYWELVGTQTAFRWPGYSFSADTRADSVLGATGNEYFMVAAHSVTDQHIAFASNVMTGHSVDNLAPAAPLFLTAQRAGANVHLKWNRVHVSDLKNYSVYRAGASGVTPVPADFLANDNDTVLVDASAPTSALYYIVTATDVHLNQGKPSNEANVSATTGVGNLPPITALTVLQNRPNPFAAVTQVEIGLPAAGSIHIEVFDVAGRRVSEETVAGVKGWQEIALSSVDTNNRPLASGVYFCTVHASGTTLTRKMVIAR